MFLGRKKKQPSQTAFNFNDVGTPAHVKGHRVFNDPQMSFDFVKGHYGSIGTRRHFGRALQTQWTKTKKSYGRGSVLFDALLIPAYTIAGGIGGASDWGSPTGLEEDYVGGFVAGSISGAAGGVTGAVAGTAGWMAGSTIGTTIGMFTGPLAPFLAPTLGILGGFAGGAYGWIKGEKFGGSLVQRPARFAGMAARAVAKDVRATDRIQFGGSFVDNRDAHTMRQAAVRDMSGSMMNARQYLGNEAIFFHER